MRHIGLSDCYFLMVSEYRIYAWRIGETIGPSDIGSRPQSVGLAKTYRMPSSLVYFAFQRGPEMKLLKCYQKKDTEKYRIKKSRIFESRHSIASLIK
jgi:hypothetical protein